MSRFVAVSGLSTFIMLVGVFGAGLAFAEPVGVIETVEQTIPTVLAVLIGAAVAGIALAASVLTERFAAPARAKALDARTPLDDFVIQADAYADSLNIDRLTDFLTDFALSRLDLVLDPLLSQAAKAEAMLDDGMAAWQRRNPIPAAAMNIDPVSMKERIAGAVGKIMVNAAGAAAGQIAKVGAAAADQEAGGDARPVA